MRAPVQTTIFQTRFDGIFTEIKSTLKKEQLDRTNQGNFLGDSLNNRDYVRTQIQFRRERQS